MSRTDRTRPWWVRLADAPGVTCIPVHDHRYGPCTLPDEITASTADRNRYTTRGCYWAATDHFNFDLGGVTGGREWQEIRREDRRRDRRQARRDLRAYRDDD
jgi:hypothetical protein